MTSSAELVERASEARGLCDPECQGRCKVCPQELVSDFVAHVSTLQTELDALKKWWDENPNLLHHKLAAVRVEKEKLETALRPFAQLADLYESVCTDGWISWLEFLDDHFWPSEMECNYARAALAPPSPGAGTVSAEEMLTATQAKSAANHVRVTRLQEALQEQLFWHERQDKALSKSGRGDANYYWQRSQHAEQIAAINNSLRLLATKPGE